MNFGTGFPLAALPDTHAVRDFGQTLDEAGFDFVTASGHLLSTELERLSGRPPATYVGPFHDPFVLFAFLAGLTRHLRFRNSILILPLYQTAVVAKQAAELSILSGGRYDLGVGISWNELEYQAVNQNIHNRGRRLEEQIEVLRLLWTKPFVDFKGRWHHLEGVGLNRLPSEPIPIWMGSGTDEKVLRRVARLADGFIPLGDPVEPAARIRAFMAEEGRDPSTFRLSARIAASSEGADAWVKTARGLQEIGVTDLAISAPPELEGPKALERIVEAKNALAGELA